MSVVPKESIAELADNLLDHARRGDRGQLELHGLNPAVSGLLNRTLDAEGAVAAAEMEQQAIALFSNPRQAKRQCGRSQRVIKVPDSGVFGRTAPFILAQGISRIVLEGSLYAIPGA